MSNVSMDLKNTLASRLSRLWRLIKLKDPITVSGFLPAQLSTHSKRTHPEPVTQRSASRSLPACPIVGFGGAIWQGRVGAVTRERMREEPEAAPSLSLMNLHPGSDPKPRSPLVKPSTPSGDRQIDCLKNCNCLTFKVWVYRPQLVLLCGLLYGLWHWSG